MAYQYKAAIARSKGLDGTWSSIDAGGMQLNALLGDYSKVYLTLTNPVLTSDVYLDLDAVRYQIAPSSIPRTLNDYLVSVGNATLPTLDALPEFTVAPAMYSDAWRAGFTVQPVDIGRNPNAQLPVGAKNDLLLSKPGQDFSQVAKYALVTVNGFFHRTGGSPEGIYVVDGGKSGRIRNDNQVGVYSFKDVADLDIIPITPEMVYKTDPSETYGEFAHVRLPYSMDGKTLLLVLGGYLHVLDDTYKLVGERSVKIDFNNYPLPERIFEAQYSIDISGLDLEASPNNDAQYTVADLYSDRTILNYLTLSQSFFVAVNTAAFYMKRISVEGAKLPGRYYGDLPLRYPLIGGVGRVYDYFLQPDSGQWVYMAEPVVDTQFNFRTQSWQIEHSIDATRNTVTPWRYSRAFLLEMGKYL
jgi:hypothetical protein